MATPGQTVTTIKTVTQTLEGLRVSTYQVSIVGVVTSLISSDPNNYVLGPSATTVSLPPASSSAAVTSSTAGSSSPATSTATGTIANPGGSNGTATTSSTATSCPAPVDQTPVGGIVGGTIGGLIAGIVIGSLVAFLLFRRKRPQHSYDQQQQQQHHTQPVYVASTTTKGHHSGGAPTEKPQPAAPFLSLQHFLLEATPDKDLASEFHSLADLVQQHVENNYHLQPVSADATQLTQTLRNLGISGNDASGGTSPETIVALALDPRTRAPALRHVVSRVLLSSADLTARSALSMLPVPIAAFAQSVPPVERHGGDAQATATALTQWRTLSAFLLHPTRSQRTPLTPSEAALAPQTRALSAALNAFLEPFVVAAGRYAQTEHLQAVVVECAKFGYVLLSQPGEWRCVYVHSGNGLVVFPGLEKVSGRDGVGYGGGRSVVAPAVVQV